MIIKIAKARFWFLAFFLGAQFTHCAYATNTVVLEATFTTVSNGWEKVERWNDIDTAFQPEGYPSDGRMDQSGQRITFFSSLQPDSGQFLLYSAPGWDTNSVETPVLLVHGAFENADWAWANPGSSSIGCGALTCPSTGMMQYLSSQGRKVFAISFPHAAGDNYYWAEQIYDAIEIIKNKTGSAQVDVVSWSKGTTASRMYASSVRQSWGTAYSGNIRRLIMMGGLNNGWDWPFRHGVYPSWAIYPECGGTVLGASAHTYLNCFGLVFSHPELSIYSTSSGDFFPGMRQMLKRWDGVHSLSLSEPDSLSTYYGGWGYYSYSPGITSAINSGSIIDTMRSAGTPASIPVYLLCGGAADIPNWHNEHTGPSDGTVFVDSCSDTGGLGTVQDNIVLYNTNHIELTWDSTPMSQVESWLQ